MSNILLGNKIVVVGPTGGGKTTFAKKLSQLININHYELDALFWKPGWVESGNDEFRKKINDVTEQSAWIIDGNYARNQDLTIGKADSVIWLDRGKFRSVYRVMMRSLKRLIDKKPLWNNNYESFGMHLNLKKSIVVFAYRSHKWKKMRYTALFENENSTAPKCIRIKNKRDESNFWKDIIHPMTPASK